MINNLLKRIHKRSFLRLLLFSFFSILLLISLFLLTSYLISSNKFKNQLYEKVNDNLIFISETVDNRIETVQKMAISFFNNEAVLKYYRMEEDLTLELQTEQWRICRVLTQNESLFSDFVKRYYAYYTLSDKIYTGAGVYDKEFYFTEFYQYELYPSEFWSGTFKNNSFRILPPSNLTNKNHNTEEVVLPVIFAKNVQGKQVTFVADLDKREISQILDLVSFIEGIQVLVFKDNELLLQNSDIKLDTDVMNESLLELDQDKNSSITLDGEDYFRFMTKSDYSSLTYVALIPEKEINNMLSSNQYYTLMLGIIVVCMILALCIFFSYRIYKPVNKVILSISNNTASSIVDEFGYIEQRFTNITEEKKQYSKQLEYYGDSYVEHQMQLLVNGIDIIKMNELKEILKTQYGFIHEEYICLNLLFHFSEKFYQNFNEAQQDIIYEQMGVVVQTILEKYEKCYVFQIQKGLFTCVINHDVQKLSSSLKESVRELEGVFKADANLYRVHIGMDSMPSSIGNISTSYNHAMVALRNINTSMVFELADYQSLSGDNKISFTFYDQKKIVNCINIGNIDKLHQIVNQILDDNIKRKILYSDLQELFMQIYYVGQRCLEENKMEYCNSEKLYTIQESIKKLRAEEDISISRLYILEYMTDVVALVSNKEQQEECGSISKIKQYIDTNYHLNLSLDHIADEFGLSAKYVSKVFKQKTGENITNYIDRVRVEQSKHLMATTNMKIGDISSSVGIESRTTFFRIFRKLEGVSPNEYRTIANSEMLLDSKEEE